MANEKIKMVVTLLVPVVKPPMREKEESFDHYNNRVDDWYTLELNEALNNGSGANKLLRVEIPEKEPSEFKDIEEIFPFMKENL